MLSSLKARVPEYFDSDAGSGGVGVNVTVWSYIDQLNISVLAFALIRQAAGLPAEVTWTSVQSAFDEHAFRDGGIETGWDGPVAG